MEKYYLLLTVVTTLIVTAYSLECYTCDEEDWNHNDCTRKRQACDPFQDACTTYIKYGVPEHFDQRNYRRYFISKGCDTRSGCEKRLDMTTTSCSKSYYNDWACVECCTSDLCNYPVHHLAGSNVQASVVVTVMAVISAGIALLWNRS